MLIYKQSMNCGRAPKQPKDDSKKGSRSEYSRRIQEKRMLRRQKETQQKKETARAAKKLKKKNGRKPRKMAVKNKNAAKQTH